MKYYLEARSIPCKQQSIEDKHQAFFSGILDLPSPWGSKSIPKLPPIGGNLSVGVGAKEFAGPGLKGSVHYSFRGLDADSAYADDFINLAFNPRKIDYLNRPGFRGGFNCREWSHEEVPEVFP